MAGIKVKPVRHYDPNTGREAYIIRAIKGEELGVDALCEQLSMNTTLHRREAEMAVKMFLDLAAQRLTEGYTVNLGDIGKLQPVTNGRTETDPSLLKPGDLLFRVAYRTSDRMLQQMRVSKTEVIE